MAVANPNVKSKSSSDKGQNGAGKGKSEAANVAMETVAKKAPVTAERNVSHWDLPIENPHVPRALQAVDAEIPEGTVGRDHNDYTVLQQLCAFFDRNGDGIIYPQETYEGFRALGYSPTISVLAAIVINGSFSYPTYDGWIPDPRFPIYLSKVHRTKHGSDTEVYDTEGRFLPSKFEEIFNKYAKTRPDAMTYEEILRMTDGMRNVNDPYGWSAAKLEWGFTYWLVKDEEGFASKEKIRGVYDGSFFDQVEREIKQGKDKGKKVELQKIDARNN
jgi:peroxygenase